MLKGSAGAPLHPHSLDVLQQLVFAKVAFQLGDEVGHQTADLKEADHLCLVTLSHLLGRLDCGTCWSETARNIKFEVKLVAVFQIPPKFLPWLSRPRSFQPSSRSQTLPGLPKGSLHYQSPSGRRSTVTYPLNPCLDLLPNSLAGIQLCARNIVVTLQVLQVQS